jgi:hypothetical protein
MKKFIMTGFVVCTLLFVLAFSSCDADLEPSDIGDSAISKPRGELMISGITDFTINMLGVFSGSAAGYIETESEPDWEVTEYISPASTITVDLSPWEGTGDYTVVLVGTNFLYYKENVKFDKGSASVGFLSFTPFNLGGED